MKKFPDAKTIWNAFHKPVSLSALSDRIPWEAVSVIAFLALAEFGLWPVAVLLPTVRHCSFDRMVEWNMALLDKSIFPLAAWLSLAVYALSLAKAPRGKRVLSGTLRRNLTFALFLTLVAWMIVNIPLTNGVTDAITHGIGLKHESFLLHLEYFLCFLPLGLFLRDKRLKRWLLRGLTVVSVMLASCAFYLYEHLAASPYYYDWTPSYATIFTNPNYYGYFLSVFVGLSAALFAGAESRGWRYFYAAALVVNTAVLSYNRTRGAWVGGMCACLFLVAARRVLDGKFTLRPLLALALFTAVLFLTGRINGQMTDSVVEIASDLQIVLTRPNSEDAYHVGSWRWYIWMRCLEIIRDHPLFGIGFEGIHIRNLQYVYNPRPHNEFMQYALFYGVPGGLLYFASCAGVYLRAFRRRASLDNLTLAALTAASGYLASSFFGLTVYNTAPYLFIMLGLGYVWNETETAETKSKTN